MAGHRGCGATGAGKRSVPLRGPKPESNMGEMNNNGRFCQSPGRAGAFGHAPRRRENYPMLDALGGENVHAATESRLRSCHAKRVEEVAGHSRHAPGKPGSPKRGLACQTPRPILARMARRDHFLLPPAPAGTLAFGSPNVCIPRHRHKDTARAGGLRRRAPWAGRFVPGAGGSPSGGGGAAAGPGAAPLTPAGRARRAKRHKTVAKHLPPGAEAAKDMGGSEGRTERARLPRPQTPPNPFRD